MSRGTPKSCEKSHSHHNTALFNKQMASQEAT
jgi:hypothetical protein